MDRIGELVKEGKGSSIAYHEMPKEIFVIKKIKMRFKVLLFIFSVMELAFIPTLEGMIEFCLLAK